MTFLRELLTFAGQIERQIEKVLGLSLSFSCLLRDSVVHRTAGRGAVHKSMRSTRVREGRRGGMIYRRCELRCIAKV